MTVSSLTTPLLRAPHLVARMRNAFARHRTYRRVMTELGHLNAKDLADLGIARAEAPRLARDVATAHG